MTSDLDGDWHACCGFRWLDKLGLAGQMGVGVVARQSFYGGFYQLVSDKLYPNPVSYTQPSPGFYNTCLTKGHEHVTFKETQDGFQILLWMSRWITWNDV